MQIYAARTDSSSLTGPERARNGRSSIPQNHKDTQNNCPSQLRSRGSARKNAVFFCSVRASIRLMFSHWCIYCAHASVGVMDIGKIESEKYRDALELHNRPREVELLSIYWDSKIPWMTNPVGQYENQQIPLLEDSKIAQT